MSTPPSPPPPPSAPLSRGAALAVEAIGWIGTASLLGAFFLTTRGYLEASSPAALGLNILGAGGVGIHAWQRRAWPAVTVEVVWLLIAITGLLGG